MIKELLAFSITILFVGGIVTPACATSSFQKQLEDQISENNETLIFPVIKIYVKEIYGTIEDPQYRPLPNVTVNIKYSLFGIIWLPHWSGTTDENGKTGDVFADFGIYFKIMVSKDDYHAYKWPPFEIIWIEPGIFICEVDFTLAEDGGPFVKKANPNVRNPFSLDRFSLLEYQMYGGGIVG